MSAQVGLLSTSRTDVYSLGRGSDEFLRRIGMCAVESIWLENSIYIFITGIFRVVLSLPSDFN